MYSEICCRPEAMSSTALAFSYAEAEASTVCRGVESAHLRW